MIFKMHMHVKKHVFIMHMLFKKHMCFYMCFKMHMVYKAYAFDNTYVIKWFKLMQLSKMSIRLWYLLHFEQRLYSSSRKHESTFSKITIALKNALKFVQPSFNHNL